jgi:outer membrane biogenesis lipoprotein LolB
MNRLLLFLVTAIFTLNACRPSRNIQTMPPAADTTAVVVTSNEPKEDSASIIRENYKRVIEGQIQYFTFSAKIDLEYKDADGKRVNANAHLRMQKDSVIWLSLTGPLGIEGIRAFITKDSVKLLDKQDKIYTARSVSYLQDVTELPLELSSLQNLLIGNPVFWDSTITAYSQSSGTISLFSIGTFFKNLLTVGETDKLIQSSKLDDLDTGRNRTCYLAYSGYENKRGQNFSTRRSINITDKKKLDIELDFRQYDFNETLSFPFSIPKNYKRN